MLLVLSSGWFIRCLAARCTSRITSRHGMYCPWRLSIWHRRCSCRHSWRPPTRGRWALGSTDPSPLARAVPSCLPRLWAACSHWDWSKPCSPRPCGRPSTIASPVVPGSRREQCNHCYRWPAACRLHRNWRPTPRHCAWTPSATVDPVGAHPRCVQYGPGCRWQSMCCWNSTHSSITPPCGHAIDGNSFEGEGEKPGVKAGVPIE